MLRSVADDLYQVVLQIPDAVPLGVVSGHHQRAVAIATSFVVPDVVRLFLRNLIVPGHREGGQPLGYF